MTDGALDGLRVLDLSTLFAAPQVAAILGDFGADVVKVESPQGDPLRRIGTQRVGRSLMWALVARNKRAISLDLETERGRSLLHRLIERADVLVENFPRSTLERWQCTYEQVAARNPRLVMVSVSCYGVTGPYRDRAGAGTLAEAFGGLTHMTGEPTGPPVLPSVPLGDSVTAMAGVIGAIAACYHRDARGGPGQHVDVSMFEPILQILAGTVVAYDPAGEVPGRSGSRVRGGVPRNVYATRDGDWVAVSGTTDAQVARVLELIGRTTPEDRSRFGESAARLAAADELDGMVADWIAARDRADVIDAFLDARVPAAPVNDLAAIVGDPHVVERRSLVHVDDDRLGPVLLPAPTPRLGATPGGIKALGPEPGAHNDEVCRDWLDLTAAQIEDLHRAGALEQHVGGSGEQQGRNKGRTESDGGDGHA